MLSCYGCIHVYRLFFHTSYTVHACHSCIHSHWICVCVHPASVVFCTYSRALVRLPFTSYLSRQQTRIILYINFSESSQSSFKVWQRRGSRGDRTLCTYEKNIHGGEITIGSSRRCQVTHKPLSKHRAARLFPAIVWRKNPPWLCADSSHASK